MTLLVRTDIHGFKPGTIAYDILHDLEMGETSVQDIARRLKVHPLYIEGALGVLVAQEFVKRNPVDLNFYHLGVSVI